MSKKIEKPPKKVPIKKLKLEKMKAARKQKVEKSATKEFTQTKKDESTHD